MKYFKIASLACALLLFSLDLSFAQTKEKIVTKNEVWIDKFTKLQTIALTGGGWFSYNDNPNKGKSSISFAFETPTERTNNPCLSMKFNLDRGTYKWDAYAAVGVTVADSQVKASLPTIKGIAYDYKGPRHHFIYQISDVKDYAHYQRLIPESEEWTTIFIPIEQLKQPMWGRSVPMNLENIQALIWQFVGPTGEEGTLQIDNVRLMKKMPPSEEELEKLAAKQKAKEEKKKLKEAEKLGVAPVLDKNIPQGISIATWKNNAKSAYSLTFDDGMNSHYEFVNPILDQFNLKATFFIISESLQSDSTQKANWHFGHWWQFKHLSMKGHEIAAHTCTHSHLTNLQKGCNTCKGSLNYEITQCPVHIKKIIPNSTILTFAYPFGEFNEEIKKQCSDIYICSRGIHPNPNLATPLDMMNIGCYAFNYNENRSLESDLNLTHNYINNLTTDFEKGGWSVFLAHDVVPFEKLSNYKDSWMPVSTESFTTLSSFLNTQQQAGLLWISTFGQVSQYIKERDQLRFKDVAISSEKLSFDITDDLEDTKYFEPITLMFQKPKDWSSAEIIQNGRSINFILKNNTLIFDVTPDKGRIELIKK